MKKQLSYKKYQDYFLAVAARDTGRNDRRGLFVNLSGHCLIQLGFGRSLASREIYCLHYVRGGTICYFSVNLRDRFPGPMVLDAFCHNKTENNFENFEK